MDILIVGGSCRAAAFSALRAGLRPRTIDYFADTDLIEHAAAALRLAPDVFNASLVSTSLALRPSPWLYVGPLENQPELVSEISDRRQLLGNSPESLRAVRDPIVLKQMLADAGCPYLEVVKDPEGLPRDGTWLRKPIASGGGLGIVPLRESTEDRMTLEPCYYQERMAGMPASAVFVAGEAKLELAGMSLPFMGFPGSPFGYRGNLAPWHPPDALLPSIRRIGDVLHQAFGLRGLFGVDLVIQNGRPWVVEVNPRYSASVEVLELSLGRSLLAEHCAVFEQSVEKPSVAHVSPGYVAKEILYASRPSCWDIDVVRHRSRDPSSYEVPRIADIPPRGTCFKPGEPVVTVLGSGSTVNETLSRLASERRYWASRLRPIGGS